jgi:penicillin V acylase-like amidase (Ntn superfamily)
VTGRVSLVAAGGIDSPPKAGKQLMARFVRFVPIASERGAANSGAVRSFAGGTAARLLPGSERATERFITES